VNTFPRLPLFDALLQTPGLGGLDDVAVVCVQHLLETTGSLFEKLIEVGFVSKNIHVLGKLYSTNEQVQQRLRTLGIQVYENGKRFEWGGYSRRLSEDIAAMWRSIVDRGTLDLARKVIVLDDGGACIASVPSIVVDSIPVIGVEQTMSGITLNRCERPAIPFIGVGSSAAKVLIEPPIIQEALFHKARKKTPLKSGTAGIVGFGYIGRAVAAGLLSQNIPVVVYDIEKPETRDFEGMFCSSLAELYDRSEIVWGCTGIDHLTGQDLRAYARKGRTLISCSSKDSEFGSILKFLNDIPEFRRLDRRSDVSFETFLGSARILRGGFPINFDGTPESAPASDIQMTRALLYSGVLQAAQDNHEWSPGAEITLDPRDQARIVSGWFKLNPERLVCYSPSVVEIFRSEEGVKFHQSHGPAPVGDGGEPLMANLL